MKLLTTLLMALPALASIVGLLWINKRRKRRMDSSVDDDNAESFAEAQDVAKSTNETAKTDDFQITSSSPQVNLLPCEKIQENKTEKSLKEDNIILDSKTPNNFQNVTYHENCSQPAGKMADEISCVNNLSTAAAIEEHIMDKNAVVEDDIWADAADEAARIGGCQGIFKEFDIQDDGAKMLDYLHEKQADEEDAGAKMLDYLHDKQADEEDAGAKMLDYLHDKQADEEDAGAQMLDYLHDKQLEELFAREEDVDTFKVILEAKDQNKITEKSDEKNKIEKVNDVEKVEKEVNENFDRTDSPIHNSISEPANKSNDDASTNNTSHTTSDINCEAGMLHVAELEEAEEAFKNGGDVGCMKETGEEGSVFEEIDGGEDGVVMAEDGVVMTEDGVVMVEDGVVMVEDGVVMVEDGVVMTEDGVFSGQVDGLIYGVFEAVTAYSEAVTAASEVVNACSEAVTARSEAVNTGELVAENSVNKKEGMKGEINAKDVVLGGEMVKNKVEESLKKSWSDMVDEEMEGREDVGRRRRRRNVKRKSYDVQMDEKSNGKNEKSTKKPPGGSERGRRSWEKELKSPGKHEAKRLNNNYDNKKDKSASRDNKSNNNNNNKSNSNNNRNNNSINSNVICDINHHNEMDKDGGDCLAGGRKEARNASKMSSQDDQEKLNVESRRHLDSGLDSGTSLSSPQQFPTTETTAGQCGDEESFGVYYFLFPGDLCGLLIGRQGKNIKQLCDQSGASIMVDHKVEGVESKELHQVVTISGTWSVIGRALEVLKSRFPPSKFASIDFKPLPQPTPPPSTSFTPQNFGVNLPSTGELCEVRVSMVNAPDHLFVHLPCHPCHVDPLTLNNNINYFYNRATSRSQCIQSLLLPQPIACNTLCIAWVNNAYFRASVVEVGEEDCVLRFVDFGGFNSVPHHSLYKITDDFATVPFQSLECYLSNITPLPGQTMFSEEAREYFEELVAGVGENGGDGGLLEACVVGYDVTDGIPYIQLFTSSTHHVLDVATLMVEAGYASSTLQPASAHLQPTTTPFQPTTTPFQPTTTPFQPTTTPLQPITTPLQPTPSTLQPPSTPFQPTFTTLQPSSTPFQPTSTILQPSSTPFQPSSTPFQPSSTPFQPSSTPLQPSSTPLQPPPIPLQNHTIPL